jgi:uncharacterized membrane protein YeaQ/YmgE (transglycosylase-associated protein family)
MAFCVTVNEEALARRSKEESMTLLHLIVLLLVAAVCGLIAERVVHTSLPFGWIGAIAAAFLGAWLVVDVLHLVIAPQFSIEGLPIVSAILGALVVVFGYSLVAGRRHSWSRA